MRPADVPEVRALPLFGGMSEGAFEQLVRGAYVQNFPASVELLTEGDRADFLHIVVEGLVELFAGWNRRETTMAVMRPVSTFILAATIRDAPCLMSARTLEKSRIVLVPSEAVREIFAEDGSFARSVVTELATSYRMVVKTTKDLKLRNSVERLANYILRLRTAAGNGCDCALDIEKRRLASYLGMTAENLSRAIKALRPYGVVIEGNRVRIERPGELERLAKPTPLIDDPAL
ncbi:MAG TPA: helix-turn-helix domain-containing protein [Paracoccaceae bacterium]|nr:helix-turn-helix domain-containing protein [Paracoccaceae bacterium]